MLAVSPTAKKSRCSSIGDALFILILVSHTNAMQWLFAHPKAHGKRLTDSAIRSAFRKCGNRRVDALPVTDAPPVNRRAV
jgi:hypothetical protein